MTDDYFPQVGLDPPEESITRNLVVLLLDASGSMHNEDQRPDGSGLGISKIETLRAALEKFLRVEMHQESKLQANGELAIITFSGFGVRALDLGTPVLPDSPFHFIRYVETAPSFEVGGGTPIAAGILLALRVIKQRKRSLAEFGITHEFRPNIFLLTDGKATDSQPTMDDAITRLHNEEAAKGVLLWALGTGDADQQQMHAIADKENYLSLPGNSLGRFLKFVSTSMRHQGGRRGDETARQIYAEVIANLAYDEAVDALFEED